MSTYELRVSADAEPATATVMGKLDRTNLAEFVDDLGAVPGRRPVILDLSELRYIDSAGFGEVIHLVEKRDVVVVLTPLSLLRRAASVVGLPLHDDVDAARSALRNT
jgi:anti-anti-sigma regulatory factor